MAKGDHIRVNRIGYYHHGIDVGDGTVIHVTGDTMNIAVTRTSFQEFSQGAPVEVVCYRNCFHADTVIRRAQKKLGATGYHVVFKNCEHFARWCKCGEASSHQVQNVAIAMTTLKQFSPAVIGPLALAAAPLVVMAAVYTALNQLR